MHLYFDYTNRRAKIGAAMHPPPDSYHNYSNNNFAPSLFNMPSNIGWTNNSIVT